MPTDNDVPTLKPAWMSPIETRQARADYYFRTILDGQREWYSKGARKQKSRYLAFAICVIVLGALISLLQVLEVVPWVRHLTAALGAAVTISRAVDTLLRPGETWQAYRKAAEGMKREYRLYINNADPYAAAPDEASAYRLLVERVETIIAEEQQLFFQSQAKAGAEQAKGGAEQAKGGAEQAKGGAEQAGRAEQAKGGAEQAKSGAEQAKGGAEQVGRAEQTKGGAEQEPPNVPEQGA